MALAFQSSLGMMWNEALALMSRSIDHIPGAGDGHHAPASCVQPTQYRRPLPAEPDGRCYSRKQQIYCMIDEGS